MRSFLILVLLTCLLLGACKLFEPLPTLPPVLTLEPAAPQTLIQTQPSAPPVEGANPTSPVGAEPPGLATPSPVNPATAETPATQPALTLPSAPTQPQAPAPTSQPAGPPAPTPTQAPAALETWNGVPLMPGASGGVEELGSYIYTVNVDVQQVRGFYDREMVNLGWQIFTAGEGETGNLLLLYQKGDQTATIAILAKGGGSEVRIIVN